MKNVCRFNRYDIVEIAEGYNRLPASVLSTITLKQQIANGEVETHDILTRAINFDSTYQYSDSGDVWRVWNAEEISLKADIAKSDFSEEDKELIRSAMWTMEPRAILKKRYPYLNLLNRDLNEAEKAIVAGEFNEKQFFAIMRKFIKVANVLKDINLSGCWYVWTNKYPRYYSTLRTIDGAITVSKKVSDGLNELLPSIKNKDIEYFNRFVGLFGTWMEIGEGDSRTNAWVSTLPHLPEVSVVYPFTRPGEQFTNFVLPIGYIEQEATGRDGQIDVSFYTADNLQEFIDSRPKKKVDKPAGNNKPKSKSVKGNARKTGHVKGKRKPTNSLNVPPTDFGEKLRAAINN